jgi:hypothetical protein
MMTLAERKGSAERKEQSGRGHSRAEGVMSKRL